MDYIQISLNITPKQPWTDILTQELADINFESFTEEENQLQAFINKEEFKERQLNNLIEEYKMKEVEIHFSQKLIPSQNWNAIWESDYEPVKIDDLLLIRAPFHPKDDGYKINIEIQPQMSFGTGHHQTTYLLCTALLEMDFENKKVLDVGTGTGVLGILATRLGAKNIVGTDIDDGAVENVKENCERNKTNNFVILKGDIDIVPNDKFDVIVANINKNVLLRHMSSYSTLIVEHGTLLLSGFFDSDVEALSNAARAYGFEVIQQYSKESWAVLKLKKN